MEIGNWFMNPEVAGVEAERRRQAAEQWLAGAQEVVTVTGNPRAHELFTRFFENVALARPLPGNYMEAIQGPEIPTMFFIPLFAEDEDVNDTTKFMMDEQTANAARFTENRPGRIFFSAEIPVSSRAKGLLLLHEGLHAEFFEEGKFRSDEELDHWHEEVAAYEFELEVLAGLCGDVYREALEIYLEESIERYIARRGSLIDQDYIEVGFMDAALGPSESEKEEGLRRSLLWLDTIFRMFDTLFGDYAQIEKARFTKTLYGSAGAP